MSLPIKPLANWPTLPTGDRPDQRTRTFTMTADQAAVVASAIDKARSTLPRDRTGNLNGAALAIIAAAYLDAVS